MKPTGKILIIDDDASFLQFYRNRLGEEGYTIEAASDVPSALAALDQPGWDVVLVDQKLQGEGGPDTGLDLLNEVTRRAPGAKAILVTAYATAQAVTRAFREGASDYLVKDNLFTVLLVAKLRSAIDAIRAHRIGELAPSESEEAIRELWAEVESETDANRKGKLLEDLMVYLFKTIPGFHHASTRRQNDTEEIDILVRNESSDPVWSKEQSYILIECKNWSKPVGVNELGAFIRKLEGRFNRCRLGFFIAPGGFASTYKQEHLSRRRQDLLVVSLDRDALRELVFSPDRNAVLKRLHEQAIVELNGH
ncbi:MAG TPA: response regulator [Polyangiaceae bacterium]|nr:response regulator [Polyangiaceae bacterium]